MDDYYFQPQLQLLAILLSKRSSPFFPILFSVFILMLS